MLHFPHPQTRENTFKKHHEQKILAPSNVLSSTKSTPINMAHSCVIIFGLPTFLMKKNFVSNIL